MVPSMKDRTGGRKVPSPVSRKEFYLEMMIRAKPRPKKSTLNTTVA